MLEVEVVKAGVASSLGFECPTHGLIVSDVAMAATRRLVETKTLGPCFVLSCIELIDEDPNLLAAGVALFLEDEWPRVKAMGEVERAKFWNKRRAILAEYQALKAARPGITVGDSWL